MGDLGRLLGDPRLLARNWEREPYLTGGLGDLTGVFGTAEVERLLHTAALPLESVRLFRSGTALPAAPIARRRERGGPDRERLADGAAVERQIAAGATLVLEELRTYSPPVDALCRELAEETGHIPYAAGFVTPAGARGVARHYDTAGVLIRQVHGSKRWRVGPPPVTWPLTEPAGGTVPDGGAAPPDVLDVVLGAGECLYVPRGFTHVGDATGEASVHLSVALRPVPWITVLRGLLEEAQEAPELRESLPYGFHRADPAELAELLRSRAGVLARELTAAACGPAGRRALERRRAAAAAPPPAPPGLLAALLATAPATAAAGPAAAPDGRP